jgi:hypothetical protein
MEPEGSQARKHIPLNNNRSNNRRRGRNNRGQGGGNQGNRIDSRARGNAPQLLEKYKKLAHDASLNGDRVQTEYYLQFADHYFRVIADNKAQRDEHQRGRRDDREQDDFGDDETEFEATANRRDQGRDRSDYRDERDADDEREDVRRGNEGEEALQEDTENPFTRDARPARESRGRKPRANGRGADRAETSAGLDPDSLPPSIGARAEADESEGEEKRPRRRSRRPRADGDDETVEVFG